jgi:hypothetical protein
VRNDEACAEEFARIGGNRGYPFPAMKNGEARDPGIAFPPDDRSLYALKNSCHKLPFELNWVQVAQQRLQPFPVVDIFDKVPDLGTYIGQVATLASIYISSYLSGFTKDSR